MLPTLLCGLGSAHHHNQDDSWNLLLAEHFGKYGSWPSPRSLTVIGKGSTLYLVSPWSLAVREHLKAQCSFIVSCYMSLSSPQVFLSSAHKQKLDLTNLQKSPKRSPYSPRQLPRWWKLTKSLFFARVTLTFLLSRFETHPVGTQKPNSY